MSRKKTKTQSDENQPEAQKHEIRPGQSIELLKELHILTRDGKLNQDSRRKLKQVYHLYQFIEPLLNDVLKNKSQVNLIDHGAGKSYLGFILYDLFFKELTSPAHIYGIETRNELVIKSQELANRLEFKNMSFLNLSVSDAIHSELLPPSIDIVTALHACNTATDDAIDFALQKKSKFIILVPCCQAEVAAVLKKNRKATINNSALAEIWNHPIHAREFGSHISNVLRCLRLEAHGYAVTATELIGWEHSMKNELIIAKHQGQPKLQSKERLITLLKGLGLEELNRRFAV